MGLSQFSIEVQLKFNDGTLSNFKASLLAYAGRSAQSLLSLNHRTESCITHLQYIYNVYYG